MPSALAQASGDDINQSITTDQSSGVWSLTSENDLFGWTDRNYSNGLRIERISPANKINPLLSWIADRLPVLDLKRTELREGYALAHAIFTPEDIELASPDPSDRPYAGWLYGSATVVATTGDTQDVLQLNLGVVGPAAGAEFVQDNWHNVIDVERPRGWDSQLQNEPGIELIARRSQRFDGPRLPFGWESDYAISGGATLGNVRTHASLGGTVRAGWDLSADFGPPRIRPALAGAGTFEPSKPLGGYIFAGVEGRVVGRDMFLDGNLERQSPRVAGRRDLVADIQLGAAVNIRKTQVAFTFVHRTEEFINQAGPQRFGAVSISIAR